MAVAFVLFDHCFPMIGSTVGAMGVSVFFALSGFLITSLLLEENLTTGRIRLARFYRRRAARLLPALWVLIAVLALLRGAVGTAFPMRWERVPLVLAYLGNVDQAGEPFTGHTWSLGVEEQFYLTFPLLLLLLARFPRHRLIGVLILGAGVSALLRLELWDGSTWFSYHRVYYATDTNLTGLLLGAALAVWLPSRGASRPVTRPRVCGTLLGSLAMLGVLNPTLNGSVDGTLVAVLAAVAAIHCSVGEPGGWLSWRPLTYLGRRSYGIYLWHFPLLSLGEIVWGTTGWLVMLPVSLMVAEASWRFVEAPILEWATAPHSGKTPNEERADAPRNEVGPPRPAPQR